MQGRIGVPELDYAQRMVSFRREGPQIDLAAMTCKIDVRSRSKGDLFRHLRSLFRFFFFFSVHFS